MEICARLLAPLISDFGEKKPKTTESFTSLKQNCPQLLNKARPLIFKQKQKTIRKFSDIDIAYPIDCISAFTANISMEMFL